LDESSSLTTPTASNIIASSTNTIASNTNTSRNWEYVKQPLSSHVPIPWERIYDDGRALELFENHTKWNAMKSNYYRWKKK
jgi:hypothetical protein